MTSSDIIFGIHSIFHCLINPIRSSKKLYVTEDGLKSLHQIFDKEGLSKKVLSEIPIITLSSHKLNEEAQKRSKELGWSVERVPNGVFLEVSNLVTNDANTLYKEALTPNKKILILDQITDVHNQAAIFRTAQFYGVDTIVIPGKPRSYSPGFYRIASGSTEYLNVYYVGSLTKTVSKLISLNVRVIGLGERAKNALIESSDGQPTALIIGNEEKGISNSVQRVLTEFVSLNSLGKISSLNASVAAAIAMEKCFSR